MRGFYITDAYKAIDKAGEWFKDASTDTLYYQAEAGQNPNNLEIEFKNRGYALDIRGQDYVRIEGMNFRGASVYANSNSDNNVYQGNRFYAFERDTVGRLWLTGDNNVLRDNEISHVFTVAASFAGTGNSAINNYIHDIGFNATARVFTMSGSEHLVSHNTVRTFARSFLDGYPSRSEFAHNLFEDGARLSFDTGVFDGDGGGGNDSGSVFHHNVFRNTQSRGIYMPFYAGNNFVAHHNIIYNFGPTAFSTGGTAFRKSYHNTIIGDAPSGVIDAGEAAVGTRYNNNLQVSLTDVASLGIDFRGNHNYAASDFVDFANNDFRLTAGSDAIDTGVFLPSVNDGFSGSAPDAGAIEFGESMFPVGHDFASPPTPVYSWQPLPGTNLFENGQFTSPLSGWSATGTPVLFDGNGWNLKSDSLTGTFRTNSVEFEPGEGLSRTFSGLKPDTTYVVGAAARLINQPILAEDWAGKTSGVSTGTYRGQEYVDGFGAGEWARYENIDFGELGQFDQVEIIFSRPVTTDPTIDANFQLRLGSATGQVVGDFSEFRSLLNTQSWLRARVALGAVSGMQTVYLVGSGADVGEIAIDSVRLLKNDIAADDKLSVAVQSDGLPKMTAGVGFSDWMPGYETFTFKTGPAATSAELSFLNSGRYLANLDRLYMLEQEDRSFDATLNATAQASSLIDGTTADAILDGSVDSSGTLTDDQPDSWVQVDLQSRYDIDRIRITAPTSDPTKIVGSTLIDTTIGNGSFEDLTGATPDLGNNRIGGPNSTAVIPGWTAVTQGSFGGFDDDRSYGASHGTEYAFVNSGARLTLTSDSLTAHATQVGDVFRLSFDTGNMDGTTHNYEARIRFGGQTRLLGAFTDSTNSQTTGALTTYSFNYTAGVEDVGLNPIIEIWMQNTGGTQLFIDSVKLDVDVDETIRPGNFRVSVWSTDPRDGGHELWGQNYLATSEIGLGEALLLKSNDLADDGVTALQDVDGRFVRVQLLGNNTGGTGNLAIGEIEVWALDEDNLATTEGIADQSSTVNSNVALNGIDGDRSTYSETSTDGGKLALCSSWRLAISKYSIAMMRSTKS